MSKNKKPTMPEPRNHIVVIARARNSSGPMRDRRARRQKDRDARDLRNSY